MRALFLMFEVSTTGKLFPVSIRKHVKLNNIRIIFSKGLNQHLVKLLGLKLLVERVFLGLRVRSLPVMVAYCRCTLDLRRQDLNEWAIEVV